MDCTAPGCPRVQNAGESLIDMMLPWLRASVPTGIDGGNFTPATCKGSRCEDVVKMLRY